MSSSASVVSAPPAHAEKTSEPQTKSTVALFTHQQREPDVRIAAGQELDIEGECIPIYVGSKAHRKEFYVHRRLFTSRSQFLNTRGIAPLHGQIQLPEVDPATFQLYIVLTYTGLLATKDLPSEWPTLIDVYILAEKLQDSQAKYLAADAMHSFLRSKLHRNNGKLHASDRTRAQFTAQSVAHLYKNTSAGSPARKVVVELFADNNLQDWLIRAGDTLPREFLFDVMLRLVQKRPSVVFGNMLDQLSFNYHEEVNGTKETACEPESTMKRPASDELVAGEAGASMFKFSQGAKK